MNWITVAVLLIGLLIWRGAKPQRPRKGGKRTNALPGGLSGEQIEALLASNDEAEMVANMGRVSAPLDRHRILSAVVIKIYPGRKDPAVRAHLYACGKTYLEEFGTMAPGLQAASESGTMDVPVFKCLAIAMEEDRRYAEALAICRLAMQWGVDDGTKTGYAGRADRLKKKMAVH